jgi:hypothetical protein
MVLFVGYSCALLAVLLWIALLRNPPEVSGGESETLAHRFGPYHGPVSAHLKVNPVLGAVPAKVVEGGRILSATRTPDDEISSSLISGQRPDAKDLPSLPTGQREKAGARDGADDSSEEFEAAVEPRPISQHAVTAVVAMRGPAEAGFVESSNKETPRMKVTRQTEWQANPVEDTKLTYTGANDSFRLTVRQASSGGFVETNSLWSFEPSAEDWHRLHKTARSERIDWALFDAKDFGLTAFAYRNEIGSGFEPFGQTKKEFAAPGTMKTKAGGQARIGPVGFGLAQTKLQSIDFAEGSIATQQEASLTVDLPDVLARTSGASSKLLPRLWLIHSQGGTPTTASKSELPGTVTTSFGGSWSWDPAHISVSYWEYASDGSERGPQMAWAGRGLEASFGAYYSSWGVDVSASYGHSDDVAPYWQSAGFLYNSSITLSYAGEGLPGISVTTAFGNYNLDALSYGAASDSYGVSTNTDFWNITAGLDFTSYLWDSDAIAARDSSLKLLYRNVGNFYSDAGGTVNQIDHVVAMMFRQKF